MIKKIKFGILLSLLLLIFLPLWPVSADVGPKPGMSFSFEQGIPGSTLTITSGMLFECEQADCRDAKPLEQLGPQGFSCESTSCSALAYGFSTYHQIKIKFSDGKIRQSNIFETDGFNSNYKVTILQDELLVEPTPSVNLLSTTTYIVLGVCCLCGGAVFIIVIVLIVWLAIRKK